VGVTKTAAADINLGDLLDQSIGTTPGLVPQRSSVNWIGVPGSTVAGGGTMTKVNQAFVLPIGGTGSGTTAWILTPADLNMAVSIQCNVGGTPADSPRFVVYYMTDGTTAMHLVDINVPTAGGGYWWTIEVPDAAQQVALQIFQPSAGGTAQFTANLISTRS